MSPIRPLAVCVVRRGDEILVGRGMDTVKDEVFYRPLGGAIEFCEPSEAAVRRELMEEIGAELADVRLRAVLENVFEYEGRPGHEVVFVYEARLTDPALYARETFDWIGADGEGWARVGWRSLDDFRRGEAPLYPDGLIEVLADGERGGPARHLGATRGGPLKPRGRPAP